MYARIFQSIYDGTLVEDWRALVTFQQMLVLCDADGVLDMTPRAISRRTGIPIEHIEAGIHVLESPDPTSRTETEEGRRIVRIDPHREWGWRLVNYTKYKEIRNEEDRREYMRKYMADRRKDEKFTNVNSKQELAKLAHIDVDVDVNELNILGDSAQPTHNSDFQNAWDEYPKRSGADSRRDAEKSWNARLKEGHTADEMLQGVRRYQAWCKQTQKINTEFVMQARKFFGPSKHFLEKYQTDPPRDRRVSL